jgi:hypothetical protein
MEAGWSASDWLGVITAGSLWTPLIDERDFDENIRQLMAQIQSAVGTANDADDESFSTDQDELFHAYRATTEPAAKQLFSLEEMRQELERLRADSEKAGAHLATVAGEECSLPAAIPEMRDGLVVSNAMHTLVDTVASITSKRFVGFWGTGGIGKTMTSAWLCRQERVRRHFGMVVWLALGQTPNILACQRQLYTQLTGQELAQEASAQEKLDTIQQAFVGKTVLLVLDDAWDQDIIAKFALIDETTHSRVLISSRVASTLVQSGCEIVSIGLPTEADAMQMVMAAAGVAVGVAAPEEAREVVRLCKLLPLTLGIAGRLVRGLELQNDWAEAAKMMREELSDVGGEARSAEDTVISTSLKAIKGREADSARALFSAFRLVPEDAQIPLQALAWVYEASVAAGHSGVSSGTPTMLQLRRWTKLLIERCLVLGPIDTPSLHDIVKDYAESVDDVQVTRAAHRHLVNIYRQRRPTDGGWDLLETDDRLSRYVIKHAEEHIRASWLPGDAWKTDMDAICWLEDFHTTQDAIPLAVAHFLGTERVSELARQAEREGEWWSASLRWSAIAHANLSSAVESIPMFKASAEALENVKPTTTAAQDAKDRLELKVIVMILLAWDPKDFEVFGQHCSRLCRAKGAQENPAHLFTLTLFDRGFPEWSGRFRKGAAQTDPTSEAGKIELKFGLVCSDLVKHALDGANKAQPGSRKRARFLVLAYAMNVGTSFLHHIVESGDTETIWDSMFGVGGCLLTEASEAYDSHRPHSRLK